MLGKFEIHNPGNIRQSPDLFIGEIKPSSHPHFKEFANNVFGYRAIFKILETYIKLGYVTLAAIITRWAPPSENDTLSYINDVSARSNIKPGDVIHINDKNTLIKLVEAMTYHENGFSGDIKEIEEGYNLWKGIENVRKTLPFGTLIISALIAFALIKTRKDDNA